MSVYYEEQKRREAQQQANRGSRMQDINRDFASGVVDPYSPAAARNSQALKDYSAARFADWRDAGAGS